MRRIAMVCLVLMTTTVARACLNDSELPQREREFRSQYMNLAVTQLAPSRDSSDRWSTVNKAVGIGLVVFAASAGLMRDAV